MVDDIDCRTASVCSATDANAFVGVAAARGAARELRAPHRSATPAPTCCAPALRSDDAASRCALMWHNSCKGRAAQDAGLLPRSLLKEVLQASAAKPAASWLLRSLPACARSRY